MSLNTTCLVIKLCDHIAVLKFGKKLAEGTPEEIQNNPEVVEAYLGSRGGRRKCLKYQELKQIMGKYRRFKDISLTVEQGNIVTILGANGAGKTTTMKPLLVLLKPNQGTVEFHGRRSNGLRPDQLLKRDLL